MTTFTTEDRLEFEKVPEPTWEERWKPWLYSIRSGYDYAQISIQYFWPLTEQIDLGLDFEGCERPKISVPYSGPTLTIASPTSPTWVTNIAPTLSVSPQNSVGQLNIGGVQIGLEKEPSRIQKVLFKLLGFNWKDLQ